MKKDFGGELVEVEEKVKAGSAAAKRAAAAAEAESKGHVVSSTRDNVTALLNALGKGKGGSSSGLRTNWSSGSAALHGIVFVAAASN